MFLQAASKELLKTLVLISAQNSLRQPWELSWLRWQRPPVTGEAKPARTQQGCSARTHSSCFPKILLTYPSIIQHVRGRERALPQYGIAELPKLHTPSCTMPWELLPPQTFAAFHYIFRITEFTAPCQGPHQAITYLWHKEKRMLFNSRSLPSM